MNQSYFYRPTFAEIDLGAIRHNISEIRKKVGAETKIIATVKANAYGHGAVPVSKAAISAGVEILGVATLEEALELRDAGIESPILILSILSEDCIEAAIDARTVMTVCDEKFAEALSIKATALGIKVPVHIKVDTGMGRIGVNALEALAFVENISKKPGITIQGIFTHFACADEADKCYSKVQFNVFSKLCESISVKGIKIPLMHISNSAAILDLPECKLDAVRPGIMIYGLYPSNCVSRELDLKQAMTLKTRIIFLKEVQPGNSISYGRTFTAKKRSKIATIPIGYADGFSRMLSNKGEALVRGRKVSVIGRICMDQTMLDVTDVPGVECGDEVVLYGSQGNETISIETVAEKALTIPYEITCALGCRVPRIFKE